MPIYKGLSFPPRIGPKGGWLMSVADGQDTTKIKESITLIIFTRAGDRIMELAFGSNITDSVFENMDATLTAILKYQIEQALFRFEPRINVKGVSISYDPISGTVNVTVNYTVISSLLSDSTVVSIKGRG